MISGGLTYGRTLLLFSLLLWSPMLCGQTIVSSDSIRKVVADSILIQSDSIKKVALAKYSAKSDSLMREVSTKIDTTKVDTAALKLSKKDKSHFVPDPIRAMWLGLVFPGGGQIYNRKFWKLPVFYGGFLGCMYALTWNGTMLRDYSQAYLDIMDDDPTTDSYMDMLPMGYNIEGKESRFKEIFKNKKNYFRKYRDLSIFAFFGVYALSVIDAYVDAELSTFDISEDLSIHLEPAVIDTSIPTPHHRAQNSYGLQCNINF